MEPTSGEWRDASRDGNIAVPGYVNYEDGKLVLHLLGEFANSSELGFASQRTSIDAVVGTARGRPATLLQCRLKSSRYEGPSLAAAEQLWIVSQMILGVHEPDWTQPAFLSFAAEIDDLDDFMDFRLVSHDRQVEPSGEVDQVITVRQQPKVIAAAAGATYQLSCLPTESFHHRDVNIRHRCSLYATFDARISLETVLTKHIVALRYLLSLTTVRECSLRSLQLGGGAADEHNHPHNPTWALVTSDQQDPQSQRPSALMTLLFTSDEFDFGRRYPLWLSVVTRYQSTCDLLFSRTGKGPRYTETMFLNSATAAESFHRRRLSGDGQPSTAHAQRIDRITAAAPAEDQEWLSNKLRWSHEPSFLTRLIELAEFASPGALEFCGDPKRWARAVVDARNILIHRPTERMDPVLRDPEAVVCLEASVAAVITICLLRELEFDADDCAHRLRRNFAWNWLPNAMKSKYPKLFGNKDRIAGL